MPFPTGTTIIEQNEHLSCDSVLRSRVAARLKDFSRQTAEEADLRAAAVALVITAEGDFTFCKNTRDTTSLCMGNINSSSLSDIWNTNSMLSKESFIFSSFFLFQYVFIKTFKTFSSINVSLLL